MSPGMSSSEDLGTAKGKIVYRLVIFPPPCLDLSLIGCVPVEDMNMQVYFSN